MPPSVVNAAIKGIRMYCSERDLQQVEIIFHGGEPLLAGKSFFREFVSRANEQLLPDICPAYNMQTNGTLLDQNWLDLLRELNIGFGISLDGPEELNDENRVDHRGRGSYARVRRAIDLILADSRIGGLFGGLLTVVNLDTDPVAIYDLYRGMGIRSVDFLLPDGHYDSLPPRLELSGEGTPYADWLIRLFDIWFADNDPSFRIRIFENVIGLVFGMTAATDGMGGGTNGIIVIESDGTIEPVDVLKICGDRFTKTDFNVVTSAIKDAYQSDLIRIYQAGRYSLCGKCRECPVQAVCGGGYLPHRYSAVNGFQNPSVYCRDLMKLIMHIQKKVVSTLSESTRAKLNNAPLVLPSDK